MEVRDSQAENTESRRITEVFDSHVNSTKLRVIKVRDSHVKIIQLSIVMEVRESHVKGQYRAESHGSA